MKTFSTIANALAMHEKLMLYGIRYRPNYKIAIDRISNLNSTNSRTNQR
ncbi:MAG: hypothetical protein ACK5CM_01750 [Pseudanabaena sp.]